MHQGNVTAEAGRDLLQQSKSARCLSELIDGAKGQREGSHRHRGRRRVATTKMVRTVRARTTVRRHAVVGRRRSRTVRSTHARVVLRATPRKADARVPNRISLHLVDRHLGCMAVDKLNKATALSGRNLHIGDLAESLEEGTKFILRDVAGQTANEDSGVVRVGKLVHRSLSHASTRVTAATAAVEWTRLRHAPTHARLHWVRHHLAAMAATVVGVLVSTEGTDISIYPKMRVYPKQDIPLLRSRSTNTHGPVAAVDTLHLVQSTLLVALVGEAHESVTARLAGGSIRHDLGGLARGEASLE